MPDRVRHDKKKNSWFLRIHLPWAGKEKNVWSPAAAQRTSNSKYSHRHKYPALGIESVSNSTVFALCFIPPFHPLAKALPMQ